MTDRDQQPRNGADEVPEAVRRAYGELGADQPPDLLDRAVLNRAQAAVEPSRTRRPWSFGWLHALTTAAVLVLGVTVLLQLREEGPGPRPAAPEPAREAARPSTQDARPSPAAAKATQGPEEAAMDETRLRARSPESQERSATAGDTETVSPPPAPAADATSRLYGDAPAASAARSAAPLAEERDPEAWLLDIEALVADGRLEAAREALAAFRAAYPDHPIAEDRFPRELLP